MSAARAMFVAARCLRWWLRGWLIMANNQMPLLQGEEEIIQQADAYVMAGITRAVLRGCIDRGELRIADHKGSRGSARLYRSDVVRLMAEKGWPGATGANVPAQQTGGDGCREHECVALRAELRNELRSVQDALQREQEARQRDQEALRKVEDTNCRLRDAFNAATA